MRKIVLLAAITGAAFVAAAPAPKPPPELAVARKAYVAAIRAKNWKALEALVSFPVAIDVYEVPPKVTKAQFLKDLGQSAFVIDDADQLKCVETAPATYQGQKKEFGYDSWSIDCDGSGYYFGLRGGKVLFTGYQNVNE